MKSMNDLMLHFLQDIYDAERKGLRGMAKMARAAENPELKQAIQEHRDQSQEQVQRLEQVFGTVGKRARGKSCAAMEGLGDEVDEIIQEGEKGPVLDAALIACAQGIEHYEIARYGALIAWARTMGLEDAADLLQQTLDEEKASDQRLTEIAERASNKQAAASGAKDEESAGEGMADQGGEEQERPARAPRRRAAAAATAAPKARGGRKAAAEPAPEKPARSSSKRKPAAGGRGSSRK